MAGARKGERGRQTRARIVEAATRAFCAHGYLDTTMAAIAAEAGVAVQTLYLSFGSKAAILAAAHDVAIVGDDQPVPLLDRPWVAQLRAEPDGPRALEVLLSNLRRSTERVAPIYHVIQAASADSEVDELFARVREQRLVTARALAAELAAKRGFATALPTDRAADVLYTTTSAELHRLLVVERGWPADDWHVWTREITAAQLFPGVRGASR